MSPRKSAPCRYCGNPIDARGSLRDHCAHWRCRAARRRDQQLAKRAARAREDERYATRCAVVRDDMASGNATNHAGPHLDVLPVPAFQRPTVALARERRERFREHLSDVMRDFRSSDEQQASAPLESTAAPLEVTDPAEHSRFASAACATCGGRCCERGGDHAFISVATVRRFFSSHAGASDPHCEATYLGYLPAEVLHDSCVFHTRHGCALPRQLRSEMCNWFQCDDLERLSARVSREPTPDVWVLASMEDAQVIHFRYVASSRAAQDDDSSEPRASRLSRARSSASSASNSDRAASARLAR